MSNTYGEDNEKVILFNARFNMEPMEKALRLMAG